MNYFTVKDDKLVPATSDIGSKLLTVESDPVLAVQKPCQRTVFIRDEQIHKTESFNLPFPYIVFVCRKVITFGGQYPSLRVVLCMEQPILKSKVYMVPLGNFYLNSTNYADALSCSAYFNDDITPDNLIEYFWQSSFIQNTFPSWSTCANHIMKDGYKGWSRIPMEDVLNPEHWTEHLHNNNIKLKELNTIQDLITVAQIEKF